MHARPRRSGFSLIELMIAIMILGLGMVMVATVFPVSLDITRSALQMSISNAAVEAAESTLRLRMQGSDSSVATSDIGVNPMVLEPDVTRIEFPDASIVAAEYPVAYAQAIAAASGPGIPFSIMGDWTSVAAAYSSYWTGQTPANIRAYCRLYTESTAWDPEAQAMFRECVWAVPAQNILASTGGVIDEVGAVNSLPYIEDPTKPLVTQIRPRVSLCDRVYPVVDINYDAVNGVYYDPATATAFTGSTAYTNMMAYIANTARDRRYAWTVFARQSGDRYQDWVKNPTFLCTIAITYRGELNARYARQLPPASDNRFILDASHLAELRAPLTDAPTADTYLPQPWLVTLDSMNSNAGVITCTPRVAQLLPNESFFILAQDHGVMRAGSPIKVIGAATGPDPKTGLMALPIARSSWPTVSNLAVWVFPPAVNPDRTFGTQTPVVGTAIREISPG